MIHRKEARPLNMRPRFTNTLAMAIPLLAVLVAVAGAAAATGFAAVRSPRRDISPASRAGGPGIDVDAVVRTVEAHRGSQRAVQRPYSSAEDPTVSGETDTANPAFIENTRASHPSVATDGNNFLVVWQDVRGLAAVFAARVSPDGEVLDPDGIFVGRGYQTDPAVAWNGTSFLVVWHWGRIFGARVAPDGQVLDRPPIRISRTQPFSNAQPKVASDGDGFFVTWSDRPKGSSYPDSDVYAARVTQAGDVLDQPPIPVATGPTTEGSPSVAWNGAHYLVAWAADHSPNPYTTEWDITAALVAPSGVVGSPFTVADGPGLRGRPEIGSDGHNFLVAWEGGEYPSVDVLAARVTGTGEVLDPEGIVLTDQDGADIYTDVTWSGTIYLVTWRHTPPRRPGSLRGVRLSVDGALLDSPPNVIMTTIGYQADVTWAQGAFLGVFEQGYENVRAARISEEGKVLPPSPIVVSMASNYQQLPAVAWNGTEFLVVWEDNRGAQPFSPFPSGIVGARVSAAGEILDGSGFPISRSTGYTFAPAVAWGGTSFFVTWVDGRLLQGPDVFGARVSSSGEVLDPEDIPIATLNRNETEPAVAFDGTYFLVVWVSHGKSNGTFNLDIDGARLTQGGALIDPDGIGIATAAGSQKAPAVTSNGDGFFVVWQDPGSGGNHIAGARVGSDGAVLDPSGISISTDAPGKEILPAVDSDGKGYLVSWLDLRSHPGDVYASRVTGDGHVLDPAGIPVAASRALETYPSVGWDGRNFVVVWQRCPSISYRFCSGDSDIEAARVSTDGMTFDPDGIPISTLRGVELYPAVTGVGGGLSAIVYERPARNLGGVIRAFVRRVSDPPAGMGA
jgi:hypothetical protein